MSAVDPRNQANPKTDELPTFPPSSGKVDDFRRAMLRYARKGYEYKHIDPRAQLHIPISWGESEAHGLVSDYLESQGLSRNTLIKFAHEVVTGDMDIFEAISAIEEQLRVEESRQREHDDHDY